MTSSSSSVGFRDFSRLAFDVLAHFIECRDFIRAGYCLDCLEYAVLGGLAEKGTSEVARGLSWGNRDDVYFTIRRLCLKNLEDVILPLAGSYFPKTTEGRRLNWLKLLASDDFKPDHQVGGQAYNPLHAIALWSRRDLEGVRAQLAQCREGESESGEAPLDFRGSLCGLRASLDRVEEGPHDLDRQAQEDLRAALDGIHQPRVIQ
jgi:hypothetical protein